MLTDVNSSERPATKRTPGWLFVLPWTLREVGGVNQVVKTLIRHFSQDSQFLPLLLVTSGTAPCPDVNATDEAAQLSLDVWSPIDNRNAFRALLSFAWRFPRRYRALRRIITKHNVRIVNPHYPGLNAFLFVALRQLGGFAGQIVLSFHGSDAKTVVSAAGMEKRLWKVLLRSVDHIVVVSDSIGREFLKLEPRIAGKLKTIYNGVDLGLFNQAVIRGRDSSLTHVPRSPTIISVGAFVPAKGHDVLVRAFSIVAAQIPNVRLVLVGRAGSELKRICELIDTLLLKERVDIFQDVPHEDIPALLSNADVFVLASRREGFGLVVIEAAAAMVPVVCTRAGGLRELVTPGVTGSLVDVEDHAGLAEAIVSMLRNPSEAQRMASNFYEYTRANLTWHRTYHKYLQLCEALLDQRTAHSG